LDKNLIFFVVSPFVAEASLILGEKEVTIRKFIMSTSVNQGGRLQGALSINCNCKPQILGFDVITNVRQIARVVDHFLQMREWE
jgi:hypothetical protein